MFNLSATQMWGLESVGTVAASYDDTIQTRTSDPLLKTTEEDKLSVRFPERSTDGKLHI